MPVRIIPALLHLGDMSSKVNQKKQFFFSITSKFSYSIFIQNCILVTCTTKTELTYLMRITLILIYFFKFRLYIKKKNYIFIMY